MLRLAARAAKILAVLLVALACAAVALHWGAGVTVRLDGSGMPQLVRERAPEDLARAIEADRARGNAASGTSVAR